MLTPSFCTFFSYFLALLFGVTVFATKSSIVRPRTQVGGPRSQGVGRFLSPRDRKSSPLRNSKPCNVRSAHARQCLREVAKSCNVAAKDAPPLPFLSKVDPKMAPKSPPHFLQLGLVSLFVPFCHFLESKKDLEKVRGKIYHNVEKMRAACNPPMPAHVSQRAVTDFGPILSTFTPLWTTLFRSQNRLAKKATKKPQKRRRNIFFGGFWPISASI